ncbi:MAG: DNA polymerase III subunit epsilon [Alphaproteobacteria bacterium MarineAlpha9_Bin7]|nr:MAG: DNA polymerase III subunit epsilon [Alphaproteobacteria bacterium MarineAlpha9_Bin7]
MREVVLDTETTGLKPEEGHRIIEIGCVELINHLPSGQQFHSYFNPEREVPSEATAIHGLTWKDLQDQPSFGDGAAEFLGFLGGDKLVIHNAEFDLRFINTELALVNLPIIAPDRAIDTVSLARRKFPGTPASLDALCKRFSIDNSMRDKHGALLDADLLAQVYVELIDARQPVLGLTADNRERGTSLVTPPRTHRSPRAHSASEDEIKKHRMLVSKLQKPLWDM